ncbi:DUF29 domain-containing protein [Crocosphaera sp. XPORK-15E]|uniref:DUF29 domain-containing protein n=1 Tax=Crocosphaera sp. XPORK-15E TaxID=3110247 RepID=UPI002B1F4745|nr:DUF29 domain-containing protein [Crocosphaera sp. XPORK-15E]MEA5535413.1 DUF29 domain-containing protein [Crocosphaera sp. XPORK-15E]
MNIISNLKTLYEIDDSLWLEENIKLLKTKQFDKLDLENLIEELEDLGSEKKHRLESLLEQVIRHFLLLNYWDSERAYNKAHWESEIVNFQNQLETYLNTNLRHYLQQNISRIYGKTLRYVRKKTQDTVTFPDECPYTLNDLLSDF